MVYFVLVCKHHYNLKQNHHLHLKLLHKPTFEAQNDVMLVEDPVVVELNTADYVVHLQHLQSLDLKLVEVPVELEELQLPVDQRHSHYRVFLALGNRAHMHFTI